MLRRLVRALAAHWLPILGGGALGVIVAFAICLELVFAVEAAHMEYTDESLALAIYGAVMVAAVAGAIAGHDHGRRQA
jgi:ABC-type antimicrobial peptide transport system permease subunit